MKERTEYIIKPHHKFSLGIQELMQYQELIYIFTWREIKIKYKQTVIGILWVVLQPLLMMLIINAFLSNVLQQNISTIPYHLYVFSGLISWNLFASATNTSVNNILSNSHIIKKIYFPRLIIPLSSLISAWLDFMIAFIVLLLFILIKAPLFLLHLHLFYLLLSLFIISLFSLALGLYFSALVVKYRDFRYALPFLIQLLFFLSPVIYNMRLSHPILQHALFYLNPMMMGIELMRKALFATELNFSYTQGLLSLLILFIYFLIGLYLFRRTEEYIADKI